MMMVGKELIRMQVPGSAKEREYSVGLRLDTESQQDTLEGAVRGDEVVAMMRGVGEGKVCPQCVSGGCGGRERGVCDQCWPRCFS
jgi:hypothetical protein